MSRARRNGHATQGSVTDQLQPSQQDTVALGQAVESRFLDLCDAYLRIKKEQLTIPEALKAASLLWRTMMVRHHGGDFRNTVSELRATREFAQWTVTINCLIRGQRPKFVEWKD